MKKKDDGLVGLYDENPVLFILAALFILYVFGFLPE